MEQPKVLLASPTNIVKDYCLLDWIGLISNLTYPNFEVCIVDNSPNPEYHEKISTLLSGLDIRFNVGNIAPSGLRQQDFITMCQQAIRTYFLSKDFDYLFMLESDIFPERQDVIEALMLHDKPIIGGVYYIGSKKESTLMLQKTFAIGGKGMMGNMDGNYGFLQMKGGLNKVDACGFGCVLFKREVVKNFNFRVVNDFEEHSDSWFYYDVYNNYPVYVDTDIFCDHRNVNYKA